MASALALLDQVGLPDLSMRRLAQALDIQPSALYWHVPDKQTLLALVADRILDRARPVSGEAPWCRALADHAGALRDALLAYRDAAEVVASAVAMGLGGEGAQRELHEVLSGAGFDDATATAGAAAVLHFVLGHVWSEQQRAHADSLGVTAGAARLGLDDPGAAIVDETAQFDFGVELLVSGLVQRSREVSSGIQI